MAQRSSRHPQWVPWTVLVVAALLLVASLAFAATQWRAVDGPSSPRNGVGVGARRGGPMMGGQDQGSGIPGSMMGGRIWLAGDGVPVTTITEARARATAASAASGLHPGEVMQFSRNFYVELKGASGAPTTEVLVDPATGAVSTEPGPAMMWNSGSRASAISQDRAIELASIWLKDNAPDQTTGTAEAYPGYYTIDTATDGHTVGMMSVNATTGHVWYHTWHGSFISEEDA